MWNEWKVDVCIFPNKTKKLTPQVLFKVHLLNLYHGSQKCSIIWATSCCIFNAPQFPYTLLLQRLYSPSDWTVLVPVSLRPPPEKLSLHWLVSSHRPKESTAHLFPYQFAMCLHWCLWWGHGWGQSLWNHNLTEVLMACFEVTVSEYSPCALLHGLSIVMLSLWFNSTWTLFIIIKGRKSHFTRSEQWNTFMSHIESGD